MTVLAEAEIIGKPERLLAVVINPRKLPPLDVDA